MFLLAWLKLFNILEDKDCVSDVANSNLINSCANILYVNETFLFCSGSINVHLICFVENFEQ